MFKNKYLKQLRDVQMQIKDCKDSIAKLAPPAPGSFKMGHHLSYWFEALFYGANPNVSELFRMQFKGFENETCAYLRSLGEYFVNIADYHKNQRIYTIELERLLKEERCLKEKLGIN